MGITLFAIFTALEIAVAALALKKCRNKLSWYRNDMICGAIEFALIALVIFIPGTGMKLRFIACFGILAMRFMLSVLSYIWRIVKYKALGKEEGEVSEVGAILMCAISIVLIFCFTFPSLVFPGYKDFEQGKNIPELQELLDKSNEDSNESMVKINNALFEYVTKE